MKVFVLFFFFLLTANISQGQSCCSGGAPLSGNLGLPMVESKNLQFSLSYDLNKLNTLKSGTETLNDNTRTRTTHTLLFQTGYTFNEHFSVEVLVPYVRQERRIRPIGLASTFEHTVGVGDIVLLGKYRFLDHFQAGLGVKLPSGSSDLKNSRGFLLNADMQPGSGSWDFIALLSSEHQLKARSSTSVFSTATYRSTGKNNSYLVDQIYQFGNELQFQLGISDQFLVLNQLISPSVSAKYRHVNADINDGFDVPSTGGSWLFLKPGLSYLITPTLNVVTTLDIPVYANLVGTQITPTFRWNTAILFNLKL